MKDIMKQGAATTENGGVSRRKFLNYAGALAGAGLLIASCSKDPDPVPSTGDALNLGSNDEGLLNYAYLLQQLEAAFYTEVLKRKFVGMTHTEIGIFTAIRDQELAHREILKNHLGTAAIPTLETDFSSIDFNEKNSVYAKAKQFEEMSVAGLNGICKLLIAVEHLVLLSKITAVDARHSSLINDFVYFGSFSDKADTNGMEVPQDPQSSLDVTRKFFKREISGIYLPKY
jgi:hypothetical protein